MGVRTNMAGASVDELRTALQYADVALDIDISTASYSQICDALAACFPEQLVLFDPYTGATDVAGTFSGSGATVTTTLIRLYAYASQSAKNANYSISCYASKNITVPLNATKLNFDMTYIHLISYNGTYGGSAKSNLYFGLYTGSVWVTGAHNSSYSSNDATSGQSDKTWNNQHVSITLPDSVKGNVYRVGFAANGNCYNGVCSADVQCNKIWFSYD